MEVGEDTSTSCCTEYFDCNVTGFSKVDTQGCVFCAPPDPPPHVKNRPCLKGVSNFFIFPVILFGKYKIAAPPYLQLRDSHVT